MNRILRADVTVLSPDSAGQTRQAGDSARVSVLQSWAELLLLLLLLFARKAFNCTWRTGI